MKILNYYEVNVSVYGQQSVIIIGIDCIEQVLLLQDLNIDNFGFGFTYCFRLPTLGLPCFDTFGFGFTYCFRLPTLGLPCFDTFGFGFTYCLRLPTLGLPCFDTFGFGFT